MVGPTEFGKGNNQYRVQRESLAKVEVVVACVHRIMGAVWTEWRKHAP